jgi:hypothetical protein
MSEYQIYPNSTPEFRMFQKTNGTMEMQVRYINSMMGYIGKWMPIKAEQENDNNNQSQT